MPVSKLAKQAGADIDAVLLAVWDLSHIDARAVDVLDARDLVPPSLVDPVKQTLGVATRRQLQTAKYWADLLGVDRERFEAILGDAGYRFSPRQQKLPPGSFKFLSTIARKKHINPMTGVIEQSPQPPAKPHRSNTDPTPSPPSFAGIGRQRSPLRWLTVDEITTLHDALVADFARSRDPIDPPGVRDDNLIASAVFRPQTGIGEVLKYPTVDTSAAALLCALIHDHPFYNGNKRTALVAMLVFLDENGLVLTCNQDEVFRFVLLVAKHRLTDPHLAYPVDNETLAAAKKLSSWSRVVSKSERPISFLKLRPILEGYGCTVRIGGGRANIVRETSGRRGWFSRGRLKTQVVYRDTGTEMPAGTVKKIRRDLQLDHEHGYDEQDFYGKKPTRVDDFIAKYRKTLLRLARL